MSAPSSPPPRRRPAADLPRRRHLALRPVQFRRRTRRARRRLPQDADPRSGRAITLGPAIIVANANRALKPFNRKIGPDPASQATCKIGGVVNNNSSGMCCGVAYNTYHTLHRLRVMLTDGTVLDSGDPGFGCRLPRNRMRACSTRSKTLHHEVMADPDLVALIERNTRSRTRSAIRSMRWSISTTPSIS